MICSSLNLLRFITSDSFASDSTQNRSHFRGARQGTRRDIAEEADMTMIAQLCSIGFLSFAAAPGGGYGFWRKDVIHSFATRKLRYCPSTNEVEIGRATRLNSSHKCATRMRSYT